MMTDITCPVELLSLEQAAFDQGRRQGYLKLRNEGAAPICLVEGTLALLDAQGAAAGRRPCGWSLPTRRRGSRLNAASRWTSIRPLKARCSWPSALPLRTVPSGRPTPRG